MNKLRDIIDFNHRATKNIVKSCRYYEKGGIWRKFAYLKYLKNRKRYNIDIYPNVRIGKNLKISHAVGIVIGKTAIIGDNCTIFPNVVIGARYSPNKNNAVKRHATIGNNCVIGAGAKIIGDIVIGDSVTIGANAIVTKDIPSNSTVVGVNKIL